MKQLTLMLCLFLSVVGCKNNEKNKEAEQERAIVDNNHTLLEKGCYIYNGNTDIVYKGNVDIVKFEITEINDKNVKGNLSYAYAEKDKNHGTFEGVLKDDKLFGTYTFMSEGIQSTRDLAFKVERKQIVAGFGDLTDDGMTFKDTSKINYKATTPWKKAACN